MNSPILLAAADFNLLAARMQMALTLGFHIILAVFGVGMPVLMLAAEWKYLKTGDDLWKVLAKRWSKAFAVLFAVGAVSGTVLSFELGLLWPEFMGRFGPMIALPFTLEGFAFFVEAIFVGIYLYGWDRLGPWAHWWSGVPIAASGAASAWFVVTVNSWMNCPRGFKLVGDKIVDPDPIAAMLNPASGAQTTHMIVAAYLTAGFAVAAAHAYGLLRGRANEYHRRGLTLALAMGAIASPLQMLVGDWAAKVVAETQPVKFAAMEGQFRTEKGAPLRIGGWPDEATGETRYAIEIPQALSFLAYGDRHAVVRGLNEFPKQDRPPVDVVHAAFQTMVGIGVLLLGISLFSAWFAWRKRSLPQNRWFLRLLVAAGPLAVLCLESGWVVTEVGRQPWLVHNIARTADMVTQAPGIGWLLAATLAIYATLAAGAIAVLRILARVPLPETAHGA